MDGWLKLVQFLTAQFGLPGSMAAALACYLIWLLQKEREAASRLQDKIDTINEKRIELNATYMLAIREMKESLQAVQAILGKQSG